MTTPPTTSRDGIVWGIDALTGESRPYYADQPLPEHVTPAPAPQSPATLPAPSAQVVHVVQQPAPRRQFDPITTRIAAASAGIAGTAWVVSEHAHQLAEAAHAAEGLGVTAAVVAAGIAVLRGSQPKVNVSVTAHITGATATASAASDARSASGWKTSTR